MEQGRASFGIHRVSDIAAEWDELALAAGCSPFLRPGWFAAWERAFAPGAVDVITLRQHGRLTAVLPINGRRMLRSPTNEHTPEFGVVAENRPAARALLDNVLSRRPATLRLDFLDSRLALDECVSATRAASYRAVMRTIQRSPFVEIHGDWETYRRRLDRRTRHETRRLLRRLDACGEVAFEVLEGSQRLEHLLAEGFAVEASGWKAEQRTAILSQRETTQFYGDIARWAAEEGILRLAFLRLDSRPLAFSFCFEEGSVFYVLKGGYDENFRRFGPGIVLRQHLLARAFDLGLARYEFLGGADPWKLTWTATTRERMSFRAFAPSIAGRATWALVCGRASLRRYARAPQTAVKRRRDPTEEGNAS